MAIRFDDKVGKAKAALQAHEIRAKQASRRITGLEERLVNLDVIRAECAEQAKIGSTRAQRENPGLMAKRVDADVASFVADITRSLNTARAARDDEVAKAAECRKIISASTTA